MCLPTTVFVEYSLCLRGLLEMSSTGYWTLLLLQLFLIVVCSDVTVDNGSSDDHFFPVHTSCSGKREGSGWTRGSGAQVVSWWRWVWHGRVIIGKCMVPLLNLFRRSLVEDIDGSLARRSGNLQGGPIGLAWTAALGKVSLVTTSLSRNSTLVSSPIFWLRFGGSEHIEGIDGWIYGRRRGDLVWNATDDDVLLVNGDDLAYVYSDGRTAIKGKFRKGKLVQGKETRVVAHRYSKGSRI